MGIRLPASLPNGLKGLLCSRANASHLRPPDTFSARKHHARCDGYECENPEYGQALRAADKGLLQCLERAAEDGRGTIPVSSAAGSAASDCGETCLPGGLDRQEERLQRGAAHLRSMRDGKSGWRRFPFWYTVLALSEMDNREARTELKYAAPELTRVAQRSAPSAVYTLRRHQLAVRTLDRL